MEPNDARKVKIRQYRELSPFLHDLPRKLHRSLNLDVLIAKISSSLHLIFKVFERGKNSTLETFFISFSKKG
jgi:hypothetical protein